MPREPMFRQALLVAIAGIAIAAVIRYLAIEPDAVARVCTAMGKQPWWCGVHRATVITFQSGILGVVSLASAAFAVFGGRSLFVMLATGFGGAGLILYSAGPAAVAVVLGLLRALRR